MVLSCINQFQFNNTYSKLPENFYARLNPTPVQRPDLIKVNKKLARYLGLDPNLLETKTGVKILAGNQIPEGAEPLAMVYSGHQFGGWVPQLGDGRAILLGELVSRDGKRHDIHLKGAGRTPFSRNGDGRAWIGPVLREYILSEAMAALSIPTTRALAITTTGEMVMRESMLPGAVLTRTASSHIRVGTFQFFSSKKDIEGLRVLSKHVIDRHYPEAWDSPNPYSALLEGVVARQAELIAKWMGVGFIHGVMNTDNMAISGETIDYGPCAFMDTYHPYMVFSSIDRNGRYAYAKQPSIALWNLSCFASCILPLINEDTETAAKIATERLNCFQKIFDKAWISNFRSKLGLLKNHKGDTDLLQDLLDSMAANKADFTLTFRRLSNISSTKSLEKNTFDVSFTKLFKEPLVADNWLEKWRARLLYEDLDDTERQKIMLASNPAYIPRNHRVEEVIVAALKEDLKPFEKLIEILSSPFDDQPKNLNFQNAPKPNEVINETFCGT